MPRHPAFQAGGLAGQNSGNPGLNDSQLVPGYGFQVFAQQMLVVQPDPCQHGQIFRDDVGGVGKPPQTGFQHHPFQTVLPEGLQRDQGQQIEEGKMKIRRVRVRQVQHPVAGLREQGLGHQRAPQHDPFADVRHVGGGVQTGGQPRSIQQARDHGGGHSLAIGAGHMHHRKGPLRMAERPGHPFHPGQFFRAAAPRKRFQPLISLQPLQKSPIGIGG